MRLRTIYIILIIAALGTILYANSVNGRFLWDDDALIGENLYIRDWNHVPEIFTQSIGAGAGKLSRSYRPVQVLSYLVDFSLWKTDIRGYHITSIILHILVAISLFFLIDILSGNNVIAFITSILYMAHPIHPEAVAYISGRADLLASVFILICLILYIKSIEKSSIYLVVLMGLGYICALLSRENMLIFPLILLAYHFCFNKKFAFKQFLLVAAITLLYVIIRLTALSYMFTGAQAAPALLKRIPGFFVALASYIRILVLPFGLHMEYGAKTFSMLTPGAIAGILIFVFLIVYAFKARRSSRLISFSIFWFFIMLLPSSNIYPVNAYMAEHWLYLPSVGFFLVMADGLTYLYQKKKMKHLAVATVASLLGFYSFLTIKQNTYWQEPVSFYQRTLKYSPDSPKVYYNLANTYKNAGMFKEAVENYKKSISIEPEFFDSYNNLGNVYNLTRRYQESIDSYKKAIEINPDFADAYNNLGVVYNIIGKSQEALECYKKSIEISPKYAIAYNGIGILYALKGENENAIRYYKKAIGLDPKYYNAYSNLGTMYHRTGKIEEAITFYKKAIEINPDGSEAYCNLAEVYASMGRHEEAIGLCEKSLERDPNNAKAYYNIANSYSWLRRYKEAIEFYKKSLEKRSDNPYTYNNLGMTYNELGHLDEAIASYKRAIEIKPDYAHPYNNLGMVYYNLKRYDEALELFGKAVKTQPDYAIAYFNLALAYYQQGFYDKAIENCDKAILLGHKPDPEFLNLLKPHRANTP